MKIALQKKICVGVIISMLISLCACGQVIESDSLQKEESKAIIGEESKKKLNGKSSLYTEAAEIIRERPAQEYAKNKGKAEYRKQRAVMTEEIYDKTIRYLEEQVPEIFDEWADYVLDQSEGKAHIFAMLASDLGPDDVYRDYERTEYLGKYHLVYVGELWEDHSALWAYFYVSENFDEVLWYDITMTEEYPVLYLDEWRESDWYPTELNDGVD